MHVVEVFLICFSSVEETRHVFDTRIQVLLNCQNFGHPVCDRLCEFLFIDKIKPTDKVWVLFFACSDIVKHGVGVVDASQFIGNDDKCELKIGTVFPDFVNNTLNHCKLLIES
jgi:hypothetical protein